LFGNNSLLGIFDQVTTLPWAAKKFRKFYTSYKTSF